MTQGLPESTNTPTVENVTVEEGRERFGSLARRTAHTRRRVVVTDHGDPIVAILSIEELEDLEDELAIARHEADKANGTVRTVPHEEVKRRLGLTG